MQFWLSYPGVSDCTLILERMMNMPVAIAMIKVFSWQNHAMQTTAAEPLRKM